MGHEIGLGLITSNTFPRFLSFFGRGASQGTNPKEERADRVLDAAPLRKKAGIAFGPRYRACEGPLSGPGRFDVEQKLASVSRADDRLSREQRGRLCEVEVGAFIHLLSLALLADSALFDPNNNIRRNANTCYHSRTLECEEPNSEENRSTRSERKGSVRPFEGAKLMLPRRSEVYLSFKLSDRSTKDSKVCDGGTEIGLCKARIRNDSHERRKDARPTAAPRPRQSLCP